MDAEQKLTVLMSKEIEHFDELVEKVASECIILFAAQPGGEATLQCEGPNSFEIVHVKPNSDLQALEKAMRLRAGRTTVAREYGYIDEHGQITERAR